MTSVPLPIDELAWRLFAPTERWGWEYVEPPLPQFSTEPEPQWHEPTPPNLQALDAKRHEKMEKTIVFLVISFGLILLGLVMIFGGFLGRDGALAAVGALLSLIALAVGGGMYLPIFLLDKKKAQMQQTADENRARLSGEYRHAVEQWRYRVEAHASLEMRRVETTLLWYPLQPQAKPSRVDVFGGTGDGWASLVTTLGSGALAAGQSVLVLDFSQKEVAGGLAVLANLRGAAVRQHELPTDLGRLDLFNTLGAEDVAELLAEAAHTGRQSADSVPLRAAAADLIEVVARRLTAPLTFQRLAAGLQLLRRDDGREGGPLLPEEVTHLIAAIDTVPKTDFVQNELVLLCSVLEQRAREEQETRGTGVPCADLHIRPGLTVLHTTSRSERRKRLTDGVAFQAVLHHLRAQTGQARPDLLVVAGADHLGKEALEALALHARRAGTRLVYLLEHLRGDVAQLLGGAGSAVLFMQIGNADEAAAAAKHIGRGHKFVLNQLTEGIGRTFTEGLSDSAGGTDSVSDTNGWSDTFTSGVSSGRTQGGWFSPSNSTSTGTSSSRSYGRSSSQTISRGTSWQQTKNWSTANATNRGATQGRVYEYTVEPTTLQSLPPTAFILVDAGPAGRRLASGDCNPGISMRSRVSDTPREITSNLLPPPPPPLSSPHEYNAQRPGQPPENVTEVNIVDPQGNFGAAADSLAQAGYDVRYEHNQQTPTLSGWRVARRDNMPIDTAEMHRIMGSVGM